jgi:hypothetical protein
VVLRSRHMHMLARQPDETGTPCAAVWRRQYVTDARCVSTCLACRIER